MKICDREKILKEAMRVLKSGGVFYCLEASQIPIAAVHKAYLIYMDWCLPLIGKLAADGDASAYGYLLKGIHDFPGAQGLAAELQEFGFSRVSYKRLSLGITAIHRAEKPND